MRNSTVFITGATGGIGKELVRLLLRETEDRLFLLVRPKRSVSHEDRMSALFDKMEISESTRRRVRVFAGDVTQPRLGLEPRDYEAVIREADEIFHGAALTNLGASWDEAERINLRGTVNVLEMAREAHQGNKLRRFFYFSTAYVSGSLTPVHALEDELIVNPEFANAYEATKFQAERQVREEMASGLPVTIFRPSIVVGDSARGAIAEFNVIYPFMRLFAHGMLRRIPSRLDHFFNIVPIDFVVQASLVIRSQPSSLGKTYHLVSEKPPTLKTMLELKEDYGHFPPVEVVAPETFSVEDLPPGEREIYAALDPYLGYLGSSLSFDMRNTREALRETEVPLPVTDRAFLKKIFDYALERGYLLKTTF